MVKFIALARPLFVRACSFFPSLKSILLNGALNYVAAHYSFAGDGFATIHDVSYLSCPKFLKAWVDAFQFLPERPFYHHLKYRLHIAQYLSSIALNIEGVFLELGVNYGYTSKFLASYYESDIRFMARKFYLCDTWGGVCYENHLSYQQDIYTLVTRRFVQYANVVLNRGLLPESLNSIELTSIAYLFLDLNNAALELDILESLWSRLSLRAVVIFDDFGWSFYDSSDRHKLESFLSSVNQHLLHFPCGTAALIKS